MNTTIPIAAVLDYFNGPTCGIFELSGELILFSLIFDEKLDDYINEAYLFPLDETFSKKVRSIFLSGRADDHHVINANSIALAGELMKATDDQLARNPNAVKKSPVCITAITPGSYGRYLISIL